MKAIITIQTTFVLLMMLFLFVVSSCKKEEMSEPENVMLYPPKWAQGHWLTNNKNNHLPAFGYRITTIDITHLDSNGGDISVSGYPSLASLITANNTGLGSSIETISDTNYYISVEHPYSSRAYDFRFLTDSVLILHHITWQGDDLAKGQVRKTTLFKFK